MSLPPTSILRDSAGLHSPSTIGRMCVALSLKERTRPSLGSRKVFVEEDDEEEEEEDPLSFLAMLRSASIAKLTPGTR